MIPDEVIMNRIFLIHGLQVMINYVIPDLSGVKTK